MHTIDLDTNLNGDLGELSTEDSGIAIGNTHFYRYGGEALLEAGLGPQYSIIDILGSEGGDAPYADVAAVARSLVRVE